MRLRILFALLATLMVSGSTLTQASYPSEPVNPESASVITFGWDIPTSRTDGSSLLLSEIGGYRIYEQGELVLEIDGGEQTSAMYDFGGYGYSCWSISTVDSWGQEGPQSAESCDTVKPTAPSAPTLTISFNR